MLNKVDYRFEPGGSLGSGQAKDVLPLDLRAILGFLRRRFFLIAGAAVACLVFGLIFLLTTPPSFTAVATMIIDAKRVELFRNDSMFEGTTLNNSVVESELQVLGSRKVAEDVVRTMDLSNNDTFMNPPRSIIFSTIGGVRGFLTSLVSDPPEKSGDRFQAAVERLRDGMSASRIGQSYVIQVTYTGSDPALSAEIANVIAATYIADQLSSRFDAAERAGGWLQARVAELREKAQAADEAVQAFKAENSIFSTGGGTLLSETQVSALNAQLLAARADATQAKARLDRITEVNKGDATDLVGVDVAEGDTVTRLRQQFLDIASREREAVARYGEANPATRNLRQQRDEVQKSIQAELRRLQDVAESSYRIAESRAQALEQDLTQQMKLSTGVMRAQVKLRELESAANSYRTLYESFLQRSMSTAQQQSFPISEARVITPAMPPESRSAPKGSLVLPLSLLLGILLGTGAAVAKEAAERVVRTTKQLESITETDCFGILPLVQRPPRSARRAAERALAERKADNGGRIMQIGDFRYSVVLDQPFSRFSETIRSVKVAATANDSNDRTQIVGVVSAIAREGKSVVSANLARLVAHSGKRTLLMDCDLRNPSLTRALAPEARAGLADVLSGRVTLEDSLYLDPLTDMHFLPAALQAATVHTNELLASNAMARLLEWARGRYERVIIDFPPILPVVDTRAAAHLPDAFVMVVEWGRTDSDAVRTAATGTPQIQQKLLGSVLNKVDVKMLASYEPVRDTYYRAGAEA